MKKHTHFPASQRGSAFVTVMGFCLILLMLIASMLKYSGQERRMNNRAKLLQDARLAAESISEYGIAQVKNILETNSTFTNTSWTSNDEVSFLDSGDFGGDVAVPPDTFWSGTNIVTTGTKIPTLHIGRILQDGGLQYIDPTNPDNDSDPLKGKKVFRYNLDILASATANDPVTSSTLTKYWQQKFSIRAAPLFSNAVFYNMDLELWPISTMLITGSVHTNQRLFVNSAGSGAIVKFAGSVTAVKGAWMKETFTSGDKLPFLQWRNETVPTIASVTSGIAGPGTGGDVQIIVAGATTANYKSFWITAATAGYSPNITTGLPRWVESTWNLAPANETWQRHLGTAATVTETNASKENYANWAQQTFKGNLLTHVNGIGPSTLQGIPDYSYTYGSAYPDPNSSGSSTAAYTYHGSGNDILNAAHGIVERPVADTESHYSAAIETIKYSRKAGLYIVANTTNATATGHKPDGTTIQVPAGQYRAFRHDTTVIPSVITEVILPGQKFYGTGAGTVNPRTAHANARPVVQMRRISNYGTSASPANVESGYGAHPYGTLTYTDTDARMMTDMRRSEGGNPGSDANTTYIHSAQRSATNKFVPKNLRMIDIDMTELKKAVQTFAQGVAVGSTLTTSSGTANGQGLFYSTGPITTTGNNYPLGTSGSSGNWGNHIYNFNDTTAPVPAVAILSDATRIFLPPTTAGDASTMANAFSTAIWNGAVYVQSIEADRFDVSGADAAIRKAKTHELRKSGVRLINGRGHVASVEDQGFTIATNDCLYILGHFNADGRSTTPATLAVETPPSVGASTGHNYETNEVPCSAVADAITFLSQPLYTNSSGTISQTKGWNDAFSSWQCGGTASSTWATSWQTTAASSSNARDGLDGADTYPYRVPYDAGPGALTASQNTSGKKLPPVFSEYSTAVLCGLVPTGKDSVPQNSGGLHNYPRFVEDWYNGTQVACRIRGSFVALFECRVGTEPYAPRAYAPPIRQFGFNLLYDTGLMPPLTPKTITFRRLSANDITKASYNSMVTGWGYTAVP